MPAKSSLDRPGFVIRDSPLRNKAAAQALCMELLEAGAITWPPRTDGCIVTRIMAVIFSQVFLSCTLHGIDHLFKICDRYFFYHGLPNLFQQHIIHSILFLLLIHAQDGAHFPGIKIYPSRKAVFFQESLYPVSIPEAQTLLGEHP